MWFPWLVAVKMFLIPQVLEPILEPQLAIWISGLLLKNLTLRASTFIVQDLGLNFFWAFFSCTCYHWIKGILCWSDKIMMCILQIVFSSSATVYGQPKSVPCTEEFPLEATNPYGRTKVSSDVLSRYLNLGWFEFHRLIFFYMQSRLSLNPRGWNFLNRFCFSIWCSSLLKTYCGMFI